MNRMQMHEAMTKLNEWEFIDSFSVGGFEYMGFSRSDPKKLIVISSQRETMFDCGDGSITDIDVEYDEEELFALTDALPNENIPIAGAYGGEMPQETPKGERVTSTYHGEHIISGKTLRLQRIVLVDRFGLETTIYDNYPSYVFGFSPDGNSFALADDGGISVLRRIHG